MNVHKLIFGPQYKIAFITNDTVLNINNRVKKRTNVRTPDSTRQFNKNYNSRKKPARKTLEKATWSE